MPSFVAERKYRDGLKVSELLIAGSMARAFAMMGDHSELTEIHIRLLPPENTADRTSDDR